MSASGFQAAPGSWQWPDDLPLQPRNRTSQAASGTDAAGSSTQKEDEPHAPSSHGEHDTHDQQRERHYRPRTCRICLETVLPDFQEQGEGMFQAGPRVVYESEEGGRLLRPCKCKGTSKYVHEGCLQAWRHADPAYGKRNYYQCPTCGYKYRLQRLGWKNSLTSVAANLTLTIFILITVVFILGFIADPLINFALDPYGTVLPGFFAPGLSFTFGSSAYIYDTPVTAPPIPRGQRERSGWIEHFTKGVASLGLVSFLKFIFSSPIQFFFRGGAGGRGGRQTGQDRLNTVTWIMIAVGVATFLYAVWKGVRNLSRRTLEKAGERVLDVQGDDNDDDEDEDT